jgi:hypothetical protein
MGTHHILECDHAPTDGPAGAVRPLNNPDRAADALTTLLFDGLAVGDASSASA